MKLIDFSIRKTSYAQPANIITVLLVVAIYAVKVLKGRKLAVNGKGGELMDIPSKKRIRRYLNEVTGGQCHCVMVVAGHPDTPDYVRVLYRDTKHKEVNTVIHIPDILGKRKGESNAK